MSRDVLIEGYVSKYLIIGNYRFYQRLIISSLQNIISMEKGNFKGISLEIELINVYNRLIIMYRKSGNSDFLEVAKIYRKAAHKIYRVMRKKKMVEINENFLNLV